MTILLDSGPLWLLISPRQTHETRRCQDWLTAHLVAANLAVIPEIVDYEIRREALRANAVRALRRLDQLEEVMGYLALTTTSMRRAAEFWASARQQGIKTAEDAALDVDVILAGHAAVLAEASRDAVIATTNPRHPAPFVPALLWDLVVPT